MLKRWLLSFLVTNPWWNHHPLTQVWTCLSFRLSTGTLTSVPKTCTFGPLEEFGLLQDGCWDRLQQPLEADSESEEVAVTRKKKNQTSKKNKHVSFYTRYHLMVNLSQGWWRPGLPEPWRSAVVPVHRWSSQSWRLERRLIDQTCLASTSQRWLTGWRSGEVSSQVNTSESLFCFSNYPWSISVSCQGGLSWKKLQPSGKSICMEVWAWSATMPLTPGRARGSSRSSISCCCCSRGGATSCLASSSRLKLSNP